MRSLIICSLLLLACPVFAQTAIPSAEQMVEQLKTPPRTRSLRNLAVEAVAVDKQGVAIPVAVPASGTVPDAAPVVARPSLSLSIQFDFDSARIRPESLVALGNLAAALGSAALLPSKFVIEGHTDAKGSADYNRKLSEQRATAVKDLLVAKGIEGIRLLAVGKGSSEPANAAAPQAGENRRVKIVNLD
jgi:outer membrane protein OmpA-like peptidoglycan-associated protein